MNTRKIGFAVFSLLLLHTYLVAQTNPKAGAASEAGATQFPSSTHQKIYSLRLKPGTDLRLELQKFANAVGLKAGYIVTCVGSLDRATLRLANQSEYATFEGKFEIVSLVGTLTKDGQHLHLSISDKTGKTVGGHLVEGCPVYTTAEIIIGEAQELIFTREKDDQSGYEELKVRKRRRAR